MMAHPQDLQVLHADQAHTASRIPISPANWSMSEREVYDAAQGTTASCRSTRWSTPAPAEFDSATPYFYSTYEQENESDRQRHASKIIVLGSGPIRIGQGVEFDYATVHCVKTLREAGYEAIVINNNPETVSTDFSISDKLYFEPLTIEDVMHVVDLEQPLGVIVSVRRTDGNQPGGQAGRARREDHGHRAWKILTSAEDRHAFEEMLHHAGYPAAAGRDRSRG